MNKVDFVISLLRRTYGEQVCKQVVAKSKLARSHVLEIITSETIEQIPNLAPRP